MPTVYPTNTPTFSPSKAPTRKVADAVFAVETTLRITDLIGIDTVDFMSDPKLTSFTLNSTKLVIYDAVKKSNKYDIDTLCDDMISFWRCFFIELTSLVVNTAKMHFQSVMI